MSKLTSQWVELFRAGKYPQGDISTADLDQVVTNYRPGVPEFEEAPVTIGHPEGSAPAWAWMDGVKREGDLLLGKMKDVQPEFEEMVGKRLFPKRSIGLVKRAGGWMLHHVAFLGAKAPAVKGLADCKFASESGLVQVEFGESAMPTDNETIIASLRAWFEEKFGTKAAGADAPKTFSEADVQRIATDAAKVAADAAVKPVQEKLAATEAKFAEREASLATAETKARGEAAVARLRAAGRWVPAFEKMGLSAVFAELAKDTAVVEYGEAGRTEKKMPLEILANFMEQLPKIVPGAEVYTGQRAAPAGARPAGVNAGGLRVDQSSLRLHEAIVAHRATNAKLTYAEASMEVLAAHPEVLEPVAAAGAV